MKRGLKHSLAWPGVGKPPGRKDLPDEEGTETRDVVRVNRPRASVGKTSPMKRGPKICNRRVATREYAQSKRKFPDEEGTEADNS